MRRLLFAFMIIVLWGCTAKHVVVRVIAEPPYKPLKERGIYYALPRTMLTVQIEAQMISLKPGHLVPEYQALPACPKKSADLLKLRQADVDAMRTLQNASAKVTEKRRDWETNIRDQKIICDRAKKHCTQKHGKAAEANKCFKRASACNSSRQATDKAQREYIAVRRELSLLTSQPQPSFTKGCRDEFLRELMRKSSDIIQVAGTQFNLGDAELGFRVEPDPAHIYMVKIERSWRENHDAMLELTAQGLPKATESSVSDTTTELAVKTVETIVGVLTGGTTTSKGLKTTPTPKPYPDYGPHLNRLLRDVKKIRGERRKLLAHAGPSLISGVETLKLKLARLEEMETALINQVTGTKKKKTFPVILRYTPVDCEFEKAKQDCEIKLFNFSTVTGFKKIDAPNNTEQCKTKKGPEKVDCIFNNTAPALVEFPSKFTIENEVAEQYLDQTRKKAWLKAKKKIISNEDLRKRAYKAWRKTLVDGKPLILRIEARHDMARAVQKSQPEKEPCELGYRYRIPADAEIILKIEGSSKAKARKEMQIAQLGKVIALPPGTGTSRSKYTIAFYETTGGMKKITISTTALSEKLIEQAGGIASALKKAEDEKKAAKKAKQEAARTALKNARADELSRLNTERDILKAQKEIRELEKEMTGK